MNRVGDAKSKVTNTANCPSSTVKETPSSSQVEADAMLGKAALSATVGSLLAEPPVSSTTNSVIGRHRREGTDKLDLSIAAGRARQALAMNNCSA